MAHEHEYAAWLTWTGAAAGPTTTYAAYSREYRVEFAGKPALLGSADPAFRGDPALHNPEDLLVAALSACHMLSYLALCARAGIAVRAYRDEARGRMAMKDGRMRFVEVVLHPEVELEPGASLDRAKALHAEAHAVCFIANSVNFPVRNEPTVAVAAARASAG